MLTLFRASSNTTDSDSSPSPWEFIIRQLEAACGWLLCCPYVNLSLSHKANMWCSCFLWLWATWRDWLVSLLFYPRIRATFSRHAASGEAAIFPRKYGSLPAQTKWRYIDFLTSCNTPIPAPPKSRRLATLETSAPLYSGCSSTQTNSTDSCLLVVPPPAPTPFPFIALFGDQTHLPSSSRAVFKCTHVYKYTHTNTHTENLPLPPTLGSSDWFFFFFC